MLQGSLRAVILTALPVEFRAVRGFLANLEEVVHSRTQNVYERGTFNSNAGNWDVGIAEIGAGNPGAASEVERAIAFFDPQVILFVGVAGGIKDVQIGDVVVANKIYGYESGKVEEEGFRTRPAVEQSSYALLERAKAEARRDTNNWLERLSNTPERTLNAHVGSIAAGEKVIASTQADIYTFLRQSYNDALAVDMEGYGFLKAAYPNQQNVSAIVIRGISDCIDHKNEGTGQDSESIRQQKASEHAAAFAFQILANFQPPVNRLIHSLPPRNVQPQFWEGLFNHFREEDVSAVAPLCQQVFKEYLVEEEIDLYPELGQVNSLSDLKKILIRKDDRGIAVSWIGRVIHQFQNPREGDSEWSIPPLLQQWYDAHKTSEPDTQSEAPSPGYLLIALDPIDDQGTVTLTAELHAASASPNTDLLPPGIKCVVDEDGSEISDFLSQAIRAAQNVRTIEFFMPWQHLRKPVHQWQIQMSQSLVGRNRRALWKVPRDTLVRSLDRLKVEEWIDEWIEDMTEQWQRLQNLNDEALQSICCRADKGFGYETLETSLLNKLILKFLSELPDDEDTLKELLGLVLVSKVSIWFWSYSCPADANIFSEAIDKLLQTQKLTDSALLAKVVREHRETLPDLGIMCDCPTRLPVLVDWKNGRLRQPDLKSSHPA